MIEDVNLRYVRARCRECGAESPVCDQQADVRRSIVGEWWERHKRDFHAPDLDWEIAPAPIVEVEGRCGNCGKPTDTLPCPHCGRATEGAESD